MRAFLILIFAHSASTYFNASDLVGWHLKHGIKIAVNIKQAEDNLFSYRIVGGYDVSQTKVPYLVGLLIDIGSLWPSLCGASLLTSTTALTAGHCWFDGITEARHMTAVIGSQFLFYGGLRIPVMETSVHPQFNPRLLVNDIAVLHFTAVTFSDAIQPIPLPSGALINANINGAWVKASGYGKYSDRTIPTFNQIDRYVMLKVVPNQQCSQVYGKIMRPTNLCTRGGYGVGICLGDSGGPLTINEWGQEVLIGVSTFIAEAGCEKGYPSVFTRVTSYINWIRMQLSQ